VASALCSAQAPRPQALHQRARKLGCALARWNKGKKNQVAFQFEKLRSDQFPGHLIEKVGVLDAW
jgi:hypothetical protein